LDKPVKISLGEIGADIGLAVGRSIEAKREMVLEISRLTPERDWDDQDVCSKKELG